MIDATRSSTAGRELAALGRVPSDSAMPVASVSHSAHDAHSAVEPAKIRSPESGPDAPDRAPGRTASGVRPPSARRMPLAHPLRAQATYPFVRLNEAAAARCAAGLEVIDFGMGDPREPTDPAILQALKDGVRERMGYPAS